MEQDHPAPILLSNLADTSNWSRATLENPNCEITLFFDYVTKSNEEPVLTQERTCIVWK